MLVLLFSFEQKFQFLSDNQFYILVNTFFYVVYILFENNITNKSFLYNLLVKIPNKYGVFGLIIDYQESAIGKSCFT